MSQQERTGWRPLLYSRWHRSESVRRFIGSSPAARLKAIDIDWCEACPYCNRPLALIETEKSATKTRPKDAPITVNLARAAGIGAYSVIYVPSLPLLRCADCGREHEDPADDVLRFYVRRLHPECSVIADMSPGGYAAWLLALRVCDCTGSLNNRDSDWGAA